MNRRIAAAAVLLLTMAFSACSNEPAARSDVQIRQDILAKFDAANISAITPNVQDSVVTLTGAAADQTVVEQALKLASETEGVTSVVNQIELAAAGPTEETVTEPNEVLEAKVKLQLAADTSLAGSKITPSVSQGVVTLSGTVPNDEAKATAERRVKSISGVSSVDNQLQVVAVTTASVPDEKIQDDVEALLDEKFLNLTLFARTNEGVVSVSGAVPNRTKILEVAEAIHKVPGVKAVDTKLLTVQGGEPGEERIGAGSGGN